jgi:predicted dehydrogenase
VGCGFIAEHGHLPVYRARGDVEIVAVADVCAARRARARELAPGIDPYEDYRELLSKRASDLDFIDIAAPPFCHGEVARAALAAGLHVLSEAPIAIGPIEARSMVEAAVRARKVLFPSHDGKHAPVLQAVRAMRQASAIGKVRLVTMRQFRSAPARGTDAWRPDWRRDRKYAGGGVAVDLGSQAFCLAFEWLGSYPTAVSATTASLEGFETEDNVTCTLTLPTGIATTQLSWTAGADKVQYTLHGERGVIAVDGGAVELVLPADEGAQVAADAGVVRRPGAPTFMGGYAQRFEAVLDRFFAAIEEEDFVSRETRDAVHSVAVIAAAYGSAARQSREVQVVDPWAPPLPHATAARSHLKLAHTAPDEC